MLKNCPDPVDVQDLHFKLHCRLKLFENKKLDTFSTPHSLIACASRYGLLFAGSISSLQAIQVSTLENYSPKDKDISNYEHRNISLPSNPKHISVNCDHTILAVVIEQDSCPVAIFYDVLSFYKQNVQTVTTIRLSANPGTYVTEIGWNPAIPAIFTACKSDGSLGIHELKGPSIEINEIPAAAEVSSFCWSPKGKQIAVGSKKGVITQYKPDLKAVRMISAPPLETPAPLISLQWVSNYQFIGVYQLGTQGAKLLVVDAPKAGEIVYTNYDDICYSGSNTKPQFFMLMQQQWNILLIASSNSAELAVLGLTSPDSWTQWIISDASRAELPLSPERQETLPIGLGLDISNTKPYPWGESTIPPCPYVLMLSHQGVLCIFDLVNLKNMPSICTPPDPIQDKSGLNEFRKKLSSMVPLQEKQQTPESRMPSVSLENQNKQATTPQLSFKAATSTAVPSNTPVFSFSSQVTSSTSKSTNLFSFTPSTSTQAQSTLFGASQMQPNSLFAGQSAITPIKMQSSTKPLLEDISITPISKTQQSSTRSHSDDKYSSIFSALSTPQNTVSLPIQVKPIVISTPADKTGLEKKMGTPSPFPKPDMTIGYKTESNVMSKPLTTVLSKPTGPSVSKTEVSLIPKPASELSKLDTEAILQKMIKEDCISLEAELKMLSQKTKAVNINLGSEADKIEMLNIIQNLEEFLEEISEISIGEHSEIHTLKQNLVLSWAWYEEALSRYNASKDDMLKLLIKSQPLDSATEKRYTDIEKLIYYIESQLLEVSRALDEQWDKFQDYVKKTYRVQMPTMEAIYQAMVRQNAVLQKQGYIMKDISSQLKKKKRTGGGSLLLSMDNMHLEDQLRRLQLDHQDNKCQQYENAVIQSKRISSIKSKKLQLLLKNREIVHVTTIKSFIPSENFQSPSKRLSLLGAKMSPVAKLIEPKQIDFSQSAPFRNTNIAPVSFNSTQIETQSNKPLTFFKSEVTSSTTTNKIIPLTKSGPSYISPTTSSHILSSNLPSAFAPTTQLAFANKDKVWSYPIASSNNQVHSTITTASTQFTFSSSTNLEINKPASSISKEAFSNKSSSPSFSFINTSISNEVTSSNLLVTPAKSKDTHILFGSGLSKVEKPITISIGVSPVTSAFVTKTVTGFSAPVQTFISVPASNTSAPANTSTDSTTIKTPTISFGSATIKEPSKSVNFTSPVTTASMFSQPTPETALEFTSSGAITKGSNNITVTSPVTSHSVPDQKTSSSGRSSLPKSLVATAAPPTSSITSTTTSAISSSGVSTPSMISTGSLMTTTSSLPTSTTSVGTYSFGSITTNSISVPTATTSSIFASSTAPPLFGSSTDTKSSNAPIFVSKTNDTGSLLGTSVSSATSLKPMFGTQSSIQSTSSIFGTGICTTTTTGSIFGSSGASAFGNTSVTSSSAFGPAVNITTTTKPSPSVIVSSSQSPAFGESTTASSSTSIFANISKVDSTVKPSQSLFGSANAPQTSIFGQPTTVSSTNSVFGSSTTTPASIFGSTPTTTQTSLFGSTPTTTQTSIFASATVPTTQSSSTTHSLIFGSTPITTQTSIFAPATVPTTQSSPTTRSSIFGSTPITTQTSIFASTTLPTTQSTQSTFFGGPTSQASLFGSSDTTSATTHSSIFGPAASSITKPVFGSTTSSTSIFASTVASNSSPFGQSSTTTFGSGFGGTSTAPISSSSTSMFGQQSPSVFGSNTGSIFGGTPTTASGSIFGNNTSGSSTFGTVSSSGNLFGTPATSSFSFSSTSGTSGENALNFGGLNVGSSTTTSGSIFGGGSVFGSPASGTNANPFGRASEKSAFGGGGNLFASPAATTASVFGANSTFGTNNQTSFGSSMFGSPGFGQQQQQPTFGQNTFGSTGTFGNPTAGPFSGGTGVAQSGFGSPTAFQKPSSGFGSAPAFGGSPTPAFGGNPSFGGAPAFGAAPAFGSPTKVFGSNTPTAAFGSSSAGSPGFGNLANQNTIGFGNLAKQTSNSPSTAFSGNSSFSSWR